MRIFGWLVVSVFVLSNWAAPLRADTVPGPGSGSLEERINSLEQQLNLLKRQFEVEKEMSQRRVQEAPVFSFGKSGPLTIKSPDGKFNMKIRGYMQADARFFTDTPERTGTTDTFLLRRVRPVVEGTLYEKYDYLIMPDFGGGTTVLQDAYINMRFSEAFRLQVGKFKEPVGLERLQSGASLAFVERGLPTNLVPNRDVGAQIHGDLFGASVNYAIGVFNGVPDGGSGDSDLNKDKDVAARIFAFPFKSSDLEPLQPLGLGVSGSFGHQEGTVPTYRTPGQAAFFTYRPGFATDGDVIRVSPQATYYYGPFGFLGEYVGTQEKAIGRFGSAKLYNKAWQTVFSYVLTGENASFKGVTPLKPFDLSGGGHGAFEVKARLGQLIVDNEAFNSAIADITQSAQEADSWGIGLNWYLNKNLKFVLDFDQTYFKKGGLAVGKDRETENAILSRFQISY